MVTDYSGPFGRQRKGHYIIDTQRTIRYNLGRHNNLLGYLLSKLPKLEDKLAKIAKLAKMNQVDKDRQYDRDKASW